MLVKGATGYKWYFIIKMCFQVPLLWVANAYNRKYLKIAHGLGHEIVAVLLPSFAIFWQQNQVTRQLHLIDQTRIVRYWAPFCEYFWGETRLCYTWFTICKTKTLKSSVYSKMALAFPQTSNSHQNTFHYSDVIMTTMPIQITSLTIVYSTIYSGADQRKHQSSASLAFVQGIHQWSVNSPHKGPVTRKRFPFDIFATMGSHCKRPLQWGHYCIWWYCGMGLLPDTQNCGCACAGNAGNVFPVTTGKRSRHASRHVRHARAMMHAGIAN